MAADCERRAIALRYYGRDCRVSERVYRPQGARGNHLSTDPPGDGKAYTAKGSADSGGELFRHASHLPVRELAAASPHTCAKL